MAASAQVPGRFAEIFDRHVDPIGRYVVRRLGQARTDDIVSEVFRVAFEQRGSFRADQPSALPWLYGIAANVVRREHRDASRHLAALRRMAGRGSVSGDPLLESADRIDARNDAGELVGALASLTSDEREVLFLVAWEQLTPTEIANVLGVPPGTVRTRLLRARRAVRAYLHDHDDVEEVVNDVR
jgi:RNA polymerase sigma-70 factor (ECF subfamily)